MSAEAITIIVAVTPTLVVLLAWWLGN